MNIVPQLFDLGVVLRTNDLLPDAAQNEAKALLLEAEKEAKRLDFTIGPHAKYSSLLSYRMKVMQSVQSYRIAIAPHRRLPPEILAEIFRYCVTSEIRVRSRPFATPLEFVCSKWRQVALGTPNLWNELFIDYGDWSDYRVLTKEAKIRLSRSGNAPLTLTITAETHSPTSFDAVSDLIIPHAGRLRFLSVKSSIKLLMKFLQLPPASVEHLESVELFFIDFDGVPANSLTWVPSRNLRSVTLKAPYHDAGVSFLWTQLTNLSILTSLTPSTALMILRQCSNLKHCTFQLGTYGSSSKTDSPVVLSSLESLEVNLNSAGRMLPYSHLLQPLVLPRISTFKLLKASYYVWRIPLKSVFAFSSSIETLDLSVRVSSVDIEGILHDIPSLVSLSLRGGEPFAHSTLGMISRGELVPKLEHLLCITDSFPPFLDTIECRRRSDSLYSILKTVSVYPKSSDYTRDCRARVDKLIAGGLEIILFRRPW